MRIADTSFLYALFSETDAFHERARRAAEEPEGIIVPAEILSETVALLHRRLGFALARASGTWLRDKGHIEIGTPSPELLEAAWRAYSGSRGRLSYPDSVVVAWCRGRRANPLAFDTKILAHARE